jgi:hypothetical protein
MLLHSADATSAGLSCKDAHGTSPALFGVILYYQLNSYHQDTDKMSLRQVSSY